MRNHWQGINLSQPRIVTLARGLSPATLRVGGTSQDYAIFSLQDTKNEKPAHPWYGNFTINRHDWDVLHRFIGQAGWDLVFGLNKNLIRNWTTGEWDSSNAETLIKYSKDSNYSIAAWSLGNVKYLLLIK